MRRAAGAGLPFDPSFVEDSVAAVRSAAYRCEISGRPFDIDFRTKGAGGTHYAPSPDRSVPAKGYVRGNVRWVLWCLNRGKGEMPADQYLEVCRLVAGHKAPATEVPTADPQLPSERKRVGTGSQRSEPYSRQQLAAYKAHVTMVRKALPGLSGAARAAALEKLERFEVRLAAAVAASIA